MEQNLTIFEAFDPSEESSLVPHNASSEIWGMPKYEQNSTGNLTNEEYLAMVRAFWTLFSTCFFA